MRDGHDSVVDARPGIGTTLTPFLHRESTSDRTKRARDLAMANDGTEFRELQRLHDLTTVDSVKYLLKQRMDTVLSIHSSIL